MPMRRVHHAPSNRTEAGSPECVWPARIPAEPFRCSGPEEVAGDDEKLHSVTGADAHQALNGRRKDSADATQR
ncbi:hypothetical protein GCM10010519_35080 [Streptomyces lactacystinicus]